MDLKTEPKNVAAVIELILFLKEYDVALKITQKKVSQ
jgi:hypothetical protein